MRGKRVFKYTTAIVTRACVTAAGQCLEQLRCHETAPFFNKPGFCSNLGKESETGGGLSGMPVQVGTFRTPSHDVLKSTDRQAAASWCFCGVCGLGGVAISETEMICLKRTNCRLWLGEAWGIMDTLKIAQTLVKFREPAQVASSRLHRPELSGKVSQWEPHQ